ncbi:hypothetical protein [Chengkuizengella axinellae]|uniref:Uncharacterized protein n=1 Tax=Chengkuizengella axinellae TaxID=3064388 RepID=A0ABT9IVI6_9BACL|nr:hypothetical protein [Chengkuizengella sp. 2205SS18-9]MDP5273283.1 hypothetical protein [Chengkuizengella sp. 2205SS18-9]
MKSSEYQIARLETEEIEEIKQLENKIKNKSGHEVTLIAYSNDHNDSMSK